MGAGAYDSSREFFSWPGYKILDLSPENKPDIVADAHSIPVDEGVFEAVLTFPLPEHTHSSHVVAEEIFRVMIKPTLIFLDNMFTRHRSSGHNFILFAQK